MVKFYVLIISFLAGAAFSYCGGKNLILVQNKKSDYRIVISENADSTDTRAAEVLQKYLYKVSGADIAIDQSNESPSENAILIGEAGQPIIDGDRLTEDGFTIKTDGKNLIISGREKGTLYGVYTFLEKWLGCRKYSAEVTVIPEKDSITIPEISDSENPKIVFREVYYHDTYDPDYMEWHKLDSHSREWGMWVHTFDDLVPPDIYYNTHPEYFSLTKGGRVPDTQLCLSNPDVFIVVVQGLKERIQMKPEARYWSVSQNDTYNPCECDRCRSIDQREGGNSGSVLQFVNRVAREFPDKIISTLAYQYSRSAPKHLKPEKNVNIMLCSIECNRSRPIATDPSSASFRKDLVDWGKLTNNILLWDYVVQFRNLVSPFPNLRVLQPNIQFFVKNGVTAMFQQGNRASGGEFPELRAYLISKLLWNPDIDLDMVMDDFLIGYYGKAGKYIRKYIDTMHDALENSGEDLYIYGYPQPSEDGYLSARNMDIYCDLFDKAEQAVSGSKTLLKRVRAARLPLQFALLEQAKVYGTGERGFYRKDAAGHWTVRPEMEQLLNEFVKECKIAGVDLLEEHGTTPEQYFTAMKKFLSVSMQEHKALFKPVTLKSPASPKYPAGGAAALTNGIKGMNDYHMNWLGFEGEDMEAVVDLGKMETISSVKTDFLQDIMSWVFLPERVVFSVSENGRDYTGVKSLENNVSPKKPEAFITAFNAEFRPVHARFVKVFAENMKTCPPWHKGAGGLAWIFIDEIIVQ